MRIVAACTLSLTLVYASSALAVTMGDLSPRDFDLVCAVMASGWASKTNPRSEQEEASFHLYTFYMGRLTGRDDTTAWSAVVSGRVAELHGKATYAALKPCVDFYVSKIK